MANRPAYSAGTQERRFEPSKGFVSQARALEANSESNREPERATRHRESERARVSQKEPERAGQQARAMLLPVLQGLWTNIS